MVIEEPLFIVGYEEWGGLPLIGLPSLKVKIDTGARTSALHARSIEPFENAGRRMVRFIVEPVPRRPQIEVLCIAPLIDRRHVTSSNGEKELRYVIETDFEIGNRRWPIEITLTDRGSMSYRMLIGRQALQPGMLVDPKSAGHQKRRSHKVYRRLMKAATKSPADSTP